MRSLSSASLVLFAAGLAHAQAGWTITPVFAPGQAGITPRTPSCTIRISAFFSRNDFAFAAGLWDVLADESGWLSSALLPPFTRGANPGAINGPRISGIVGGQSHLNDPAPMPGNPSNPIAVWEGEWAATNFTPRVVRFTTLTIRFDVYSSPMSPVSSSRLTGLAEGMAQVAVFPAPGAMALGLFAAAAGGRRRHSGFVDVPNSESKYVCSR